MRRITLPHDMKRPFPEPLSPRAVAALAIVILIPAVVLAALGFHSLRQHRIVALHETHELARRQTPLLARVIESALLDLQLPSAADVRQFHQSPGPPEREPLTRVAALHPDTLGILLLPHGTYPAAHPPPPMRFDPARLPTPARELWFAADAHDPASGAPSPEPSLWLQLLPHAADSEWEAPVRFRLARQFLQLGRTPEARHHLEWILHQSPHQAGETGLPLHILSLRALLQIAAIDSSARSLQGNWLDALCYRALIDRQWPGSTLDEWESLDPHRLARWRQVAALHASVRSHLPNPPSGATPQPAPLEPRWVSSNPETVHLVTRHDVVDGHWLVRRPLDAMVARVRRVLADQLLPAHLAADIRFAGRDLVTVPPGSDALASATSGPIEVALHLANPQLLLQGHRLRSLTHFGLVTTALLAVSLGSLSLWRACERQRQLAALQADFVASVSHELRAPMAAVRLMAEELVDLPASPSSRRSDYPRLILRETRRLGLLIENVLRHAHLERDPHSLALEPVDLSELVRTTVEALAPSAADRSIRFDTQLPDHAVIVSADPSAMRQILVNLIDNALKHSPPHSIVTVGVDPPTADSPVNSNPRHARLWVADCGPGIPHEDRDRVFEAFFRRGSELRRETPGIGLGLAIVHRLAAAHGGRVVIECPPAAGTRFTVELPTPPGSVPNLP